MPLIWNLGSIVGPSLGGFFAKPAQNWPGVFGHNKFLIRFPFVLPNLIASAFFLIGITTGVLFLRVCLPKQLKCLLFPNVNVGKSRIQTP
jgi:MFS family permease